MNKRMKKKRARLIERARDRALADTAYGISVSQVTDGSAYRMFQSVKADIKAERQKQTER